MIPKSALEGDIKRIAELREMLPIESDGSLVVSFADRLLKFASAESEGWYSVVHTDSESISRAKIVLFLDTYKRVVVLSPNPLDSFIEFARQFVWVEAAGGIVENAAGEVVMIRRNERWDLPKGHREMGEEFDWCAQREAEEETGVKVESVGRLLATTLHGYSFYGKWELKLTAWYQMQGSSAELTPQKEEGIICAEWIGRGEIREKIKTSFPTIRAVFDAFLN
ncbi:MAG: NUDIX domain-containing protein [Alistipes sp.]|nr:NUDIX domain-containing protein [Alistipes sp.]